MSGLFLVLIDEPGRDLRALPGLFHDPESAVSEHVSFQEHPHATRFLVVQVLGQVGPVRAVESPEARTRTTTGPPASP